MCVYSSNPVRLFSSYHNRFRIIEPLASSSSLHLAATAVESSSLEAAVQVVVSETGSRSRLVAHSLSKSALARWEKALVPANLIFLVTVMDFHGSKWILSYIIILFSFQFQSSCWSKLLVKDSKTRSFFRTYYFHFALYILLLHVVVIVLIFDCLL